MFATTISTGVVVLVAAVFLTCAVEMVEALTIVLAVGHTRGWRSALEGAGAAILVLAALVAAFGPALLQVPLDLLRVIVGGVLLIFGLQWPVSYTHLDVYKRQGTWSNERTGTADTTVVAPRIDTDARPVGVADARATQRGSPRGVSRDRRRPAGPEHCRLLVDGR